MEAKIVKVTGKGQISLPVHVREATGIQEGDRLLLVQEGQAILLKKVAKSDFKDLLKHSEKVAKKLWGTKADDIWDTV